MGFIEIKGMGEGREKERKEGEIETCLPLQKNSWKERAGGQSLSLKRAVSTCL